MRRPFTLVLTLACGLCVTGCVIEPNPSPGTGSTAQATGGYFDATSKLDACHASGDATAVMDLSVAADAAQPDLMSSPELGELPCPPDGLGCIDP